MSQNKKDTVMNKLKQGFPKQPRVLGPKFLPKSPQIFWIFAKFAKQIVQIINIEIVGINPFATFASKIHPWIDGSTNVQIVHVVVNFVQDLIIEKLFSEYFDSEEEEDDDDEEEEGKLYWTR